MAKIENLTVETFNIATNAVTGGAVSTSRPTSQLTAVNAENRPVQLSFRVGFALNVASSGVYMDITVSLYRARDSNSYLSFTERYNDNGSGVWVGSFADVSAQAGDTYVLDANAQLVGAGGTQSSGGITGQMLGAIWVKR